MQPETGDELQWEKAGLLEIADIVVVHRADLSAADVSRRSSASYSTCPVAGRSRLCASARRRERGGENSGQPSTRVRVSRVRWR